MDTKNKNKYYKIIEVFSDSYSSQDELNNLIDEGWVVDSFIPINKIEHGEKEIFMNGAYQNVSGDWQISVLQAILKKDSDSKVDLISDLRNQISKFNCEIKELKKEPDLLRKEIDKEKKLNEQFGDNINFLRKQFHKTNEEFHKVNQRNKKLSIYLVELQKYFGEKSIKEFEEKYGTTLD